MTVWTKNLSTHRESMEANGFTLVPSVVRPDIARVWAERARRGVTVRQDRESGEVKNLDEGGAYHHGIANALQVADILPELFGLYEDACMWLSEIVQRDVIVSPYTSSAITLKVYDKPGDGQGWHRDTNPLTALLILTDTTGDYGTEIEARDGSTFNLRNTAGDMWVMYGRELRHRVPSVPEGEWRVTVPLNYYHPDDTWRPADMDDLVYGM